MCAMIMNHLGNWVDGLQQAGIYSFLRQEAIDASGLSAEAVKKSLQRLIRRKRIAKVTDSFFVIIPTEYMSAGSPPASWFIDQLMEAKKQLYYVGILSAASLHGASHHQPQEFQVVTGSALRPLTVARQHIRFFTKRAMGKTPVTDIKTSTGMIHVSTPEATALDLIRFSKAAGYLGNIATVINELAARLTPIGLLSAVEAQMEIPTTQRLGYLLEVIGAEALADPLAAWIGKHHSRAVPLQPGRPTAAAPFNSRWKILVNETIGVEA